MLILLLALSLIFFTFIELHIITKRCTSRENCTYYVILYKIKMLIYKYFPCFLYVYITLQLLGNSWMHVCVSYTSKLSIIHHFTVTLKVTGKIKE